MERVSTSPPPGMLAEMASQDQLANDLANASTPGYKADRVSQRSFGDLLLTNSADRLAAIRSARAPRATSRPPTSARRPLSETDQPLDLAVEGHGWFAVRTAQGDRYTRNGSFSGRCQGHARRPARQRHPRPRRPARRCLNRRHRSTQAGRPLQRAQRGSRAKRCSPAQAGGQATGHGPLRRAGGLGRRPGPRHGRPDGLHARLRGHASARSPRSTRRCSRPRRRSATSRARAWSNVRAKASGASGRQPRRTTRCVGWTACCGGRARIEVLLPDAGRHVHRSGRYGRAAEQARRRGQRSREREHDGLQARPRRPTATSPTRAGRAGRRRPRCASAPAPRRP